MLLLLSLQILSRSSDENWNLKKVQCSSESYNSEARALRSNAIKKS
jgi:hypothetical protein